MGEYRVNLEVYNGPLDLLLYLIRREEVDIYDIPIARITEQYLQYVQLLKQIDPNLAGEFMVLAATLMEIKTRTLLPTPPPDQAGADELEIDPRAELVRQLLEYKAFKDAAADLREAGAVQALKFPRRPGKTEADEAQFDLEDVQIWNLLDAFNKLMASIGVDTGDQDVIYDDTPVELHAADILDRLQREGPMSFRRIFEGRTTRSEIVGLFLALLELVRQRKLQISQTENFGPIQVRLNPHPPAEAETEVVAAEDQAQSRAETEPAADQADSAGEYVPEAAQQPVPATAQDEGNELGAAT